MSICLAGAGVAVSIAAQMFTLSWTHTVERTDWQEDWRVDAGLLVLETARIKGSGAGMDPPAEARLEDGYYVWQPQRRVPSIVLRRDQRAGDWRLCAANRCNKIADWLGRDVDPVTIYAASADACAAGR